MTRLSYGGHLGIKKTMFPIQNKFFWAVKTSEIARFCCSCDVCQGTVDKGRVKRAKMGRMIPGDIALRNVDVCSLAETS